VLWSYGVFCKFLHILYASVATGIDLEQTLKKLAVYIYPLVSLKKKKKLKKSEVSQSEVWKKKS